MNDSLRFKIFERDDFTCQYCGAKAPEVQLAVDHVLPNSKGGGDNEENLKTACSSCNRGKRDKKIDKILTASESRLKENYKERSRGLTPIWVTKNFRNFINRMASEKGISMIKAVDMIVDRL